LADRSVDHAEYGLVQSDHFRPPFIIDCAMPIRRCKQNVNISYKSFSAGDHEVLYNALSTYDWSSLYNETSADAAVDRLNFAVTKTIDLAVPSGYIEKHAYLTWFYGKLKVNIFIDFIRSVRLTVFMANFLSTIN
jgi:hypothetical protein